MYQLFYTKQALKDAKKIKQSNLHIKVEALLDIIKESPYQKPPSYEKLIGDLAGAYSRRINIQHRLIYQVLEDQKIIKVIRMWSHYE
ncbi:Txe/YoeB family addiction module toxin [Cysteiniphilum halobium]|uniref:Txe/YoeB family addiction module toxin n=1 Tax=Cysteiniphilum halobium TaxID=2219059 RepID=UPI003F860F93